MLGTPGSRDRLSPVQRGLGSLAVAAPVVGLALALATTSGRPHVAPLAWVGWTAAILAGLASVPARRSLLRFDLVIMITLGLAAGHLLFAPGFPRGHDVLPHLWGTWGFCQAVQAGDPHPIWLSHLGLGMPLLLFYGPLSFYPMVPGCLAGVPPVTLLKVSFLAHGALAAAGMFWVVLRWTGDRRAALVAATAYAFAPYRLLDANYRTALAESTALAILPVFFYCSLRFLEERSARRLPGAVATAALLTLAHPLSALMAAVASALLLMTELFGRPRSAGLLGRKIAGLGLLWLFATALAGFYTLPALLEAKHTTAWASMREDGVPKLALHGLRPRQLLERRQWSEVAGSKAEGEIGDATPQEMPYYFGWLLLGLLPLAVGVGKLPGSRETIPPLEPSYERHRRRVRGLAGMTVSSLVLTLHPIDEWLSLVPPLQALQFPWRFLTIASFGAAACTGFAVVRLLRAWEHRAWVRALPPLVVAAVLFDAFPYTGASQWVTPYEGLAHLFRPDPDCSDRWSCWRWEPLQSPYPQRVVGTVLPPTDYSIDVSGARPGYSEYFNPRIRETLIDPPEDEVDFARWGVGARGRPDRPGVERLPAAPYARLRPPGDTAAPAHEPPFRRAGGRIHIDVRGRGGHLMLLEQSFPGWQVRTSRGWKNVEPASDGLLHTDVEAGRDTVELRFHRWRWDRLLGWLLTVVSAASLLALPRLRRSPRRAWVPTRR